MRDLMRVQPNDDYFIDTHRLVKEHVTHQLMLGYPQTFLHDVVLVDFKNDQLIDYHTGTILRYSDIKMPFKQMIEDVIPQRNREDRLHLNDLAVDILNREHPDVLNHEVYEFDESVSERLLKDIYVREMMLLCRIEDYFGKALDIDAQLMLASSNAHQYAYSDVLIEEPLQLTRF